MSFVNKLCISLFCKKVGTDPYGNSYFEGKTTDYLGHKKRYIIYKGYSEPSKVPPLWHAWLHYLSGELPGANDSSYSWQQDYTPNLTGTKLPYSPKEAGKSRKHVSSDYAAWKPN